MRDNKVKDFLMYQLSLHSRKYHLKLNFPHYSETYIGTLRIGIIYRLREEFYAGIYEVTFVILKYGSPLIARRAIESSTSGVGSLILSGLAITLSSSSRAELLDLQVQSLRVSAVKICHSIFTDIILPS